MRPKSPNVKSLSLPFKGYAGDNHDALINCRFRSRMSAEITIRGAEVKSVSNQHSTNELELKINF